MTKPKLVIVTGALGVGKTTLAQKIQKNLKYPLIIKDKIKENLFDSLGVKGEEWVVKLGSASYDIMYYVVWEILKSGQSLILESNFHERSLDSLLQFKKLAQIIQIYCYADEKVLFKRFKNRHKSGERHLKHVSYATFKSYKKNVLKNRNYKLDLPGKLVEVDLNDFLKVDYAKIARDVNEGK